MERIIMKEKIIVSTKAFLNLRFGVYLAAAFLAVVTLSVEKAQAGQDIREIPNSFSALVKKAGPSVVNVNVVTMSKTNKMGPVPFSDEDPLRDFFERFFGGRIPKEFRQGGLGTGFVIDKEGLILTNNHVVEQAEEIKIRTFDDKEFAATVIGRDSKTDLALIKIEADDSLVPLPLGDSDKLEVGDWVIAIGNSFGFVNTVTAGIVSAKYRQIGASAYDQFIQTDASINPGNSGGPLLNTSGEVIGINAAILSQNGGSIGISFAIPINMVKDLLPQLKKGEVVRGWLGADIQSITPALEEKLRLKDRKGALVSGVTVGGPAKAAGIQRGDVIVSFDGKEVEDSGRLPYLVASTPVGKIVSVGVIRKGEKRIFIVKVQKLKEESEPKETGEIEQRFGFAVQDITPELAGRFDLSQTRGVIVVQVEDGSPAEEAGFMPGDIILEMDQLVMKTVQQFEKKLGTYKPGDTVLFLVSSQESTRFLTMDVP